MPLHKILSAFSAFWQLTIAWQPAMSLLSISLVRSLSFPPGGQWPVDKGLA